MGTIREWNGIKFKNFGNMKDDNDINILLVVIIFVVIMLGCTKTEYCHECHRKDGGTVIYCGYTDEQFKAAYEWNCRYLKDTMKCETIIYEP